MAISLKKGGEYNLSKQTPNLQRLMIGLGWEVISGNHLDLDASVFMLNISEKLPSEDFFVFYNNLKSPLGALEHTGDNRSGIGEGDDEMIIINLPHLEYEVNELLVTVTIHDGHLKRQNFGMLHDAYLRVVDMDTNKEVLRFDLDEAYPNCTSVMFGKIKKIENEWIFTAIGKGYEYGLESYISIYSQ
jgi:tellurium resistance protein TerD